jgi:hypothetical protein
VVLGRSALLYTNVSAETGGNTRVLSEWQAGVSIRF